MIDYSLILGGLFEALKTIWWIFPFLGLMTYVNIRLKRKGGKSRRWKKSKGLKKKPAASKGAKTPTSPIDRDGIQVDDDKARMTNKEKGDAYEEFVARHFRSQGYTVADHGAINGVKDKSIDLIAKRGRDIILIQCKDWSAKNNYRITHNEVKAFVGETAFYLNDNPMYENYSLKRLYVVSEPVLDRSAIKFIKAHKDKIRYLHLKTSSVA